MENVKNVLIIDDEKPFLLSLTDGLASYANDFKVVTAFNGKEAVKILDSAEVDLVVTDLRMPKMDGFELLAHMSGAYPEIPTIVMTAYGTPEIEERLQAMGTFHYLEKPLDFNALADRIVDALKVSSSPDRIRGISLVAFLQLLEMENKTCTLTVKSQGKEGHLYFVKGEFMEAKVGEVQGEEAALNIVTWDNVAIEIQYTCTIKKKNIGLSLAEILMEGFRIKDEENGLEKEKKEEMVTSTGSPPMDATKEANITVKQKEAIKMNVQNLNKAIEVLREDVGDALIATDIWTIADGQILAGWNKQPQAAAIFNQLTKHMMKTLEVAKFPVLGRYYILDLVDSNLVVIIPLGDYQWGILLNSEKAPLGLLLNVIVPKSIDAFEAAIAA